MKQFYQGEYCPQCISVFGDPEFQEEVLIGVLKKNGGFFCSREGCDFRAPLLGEMGKVSERIFAAADRYYRRMKSTRSATQDSIYGFPVFTSDMTDKELNGGFEIKLFDI